MGDASPPNSRRWDKEAFKIDKYFRISDVLHSRFSFLRMKLCFSPDQCSSFNWIFGHTTDGLILRLATCDGMQ